MKFLKFLALWILFLVPFSVQSGDRNSPQSDVAGKSGYEKIAAQIELAVRPVYQIPGVAPFNYAAIYYAYENAVLTQFSSSEASSGRKFDFPEREFPEAPACYRSPNAPEFEYPLMTRGN